MSATTDNVMVLLRAQTPGSTDPILKTILFETVSEVCREVLQVAPPLDPQSDHSGWLTETQWVENHTTILAGTLGRLYAQPAKPWTNPTAAQANIAYYTALLPRAREYDTSKPSTPTAFARLMNNLRGNFYGMRDGAIGQEVFNVVDDLTRNVLQTTPPNQTDEPQDWLTPEEWEATYRLVYAGAMVRILTQPSKPWTNPQLAAFYQSQWDSLSTFARADATGVGKADPTDKLMGNLRAQLVNAKDSQIKQALFNVIMDACTRGYIWVEEVPVSFKPGQRVANIVPADTQIVLVQNFYHSSEDMTGIQYDNGNVALAADAVDGRFLEPMLVTMALAPLATADPELPNQWIPYDLWSKHYTLLLNGVLAFMMLQPAKPFSNPALGQLHSRLYARDLNNATITQKDRGIPTRQHWRFPRFA